MITINSIVGIDLQYARDTQHVYGSTGRPYQFFSAP